MKKLLVLLLSVSCLTLAKGNYVEYGLATYYDGTQKSETDHPMASGVWFDRNRLEAAHRTLKFGSVVRVTRKANKKSVIVVITDRGPCARASDKKMETSTRGCPKGRDVDTSRIIDLTPVAAEVLEMVELNSDHTVSGAPHGLTKVKIEVLEVGTCNSWGSCKKNPFERGKIVE